MDKGYVYIGRLIDNKGNYVTNFHKLGKSKDFKVRETNLNSTHMPLDVQFIRVFETDYMSNLEKILHACFDEYRVIKEYGWRRNITTEWFDVVDDELLTSKIETVIKNFPQTTEVDLISTVQSDTGVTVNQKITTINNLQEGKKKWKLILNIDGEDVTEEFASDTMVNAYSYICNKIGYDKVDDDEVYLSNNKSELRERFINDTKFAEGSIKEFDGYYLFTGMSNKRKYDYITNMIGKYEITEMTCELIQLN